MKKLFALFAVLGLIMVGSAGPASAKCYAWKQVCKPIYKTKTWWGWCKNSYGYKYKCKKVKKVKVGHKCKKKCVSWKPHYKGWKKKYY